MHSSEIKREISERNVTQDEIELLLQKETLKSQEKQEGNRTSDDQSRIGQFDPLWHMVLT